jgi:hypothetical protein
MAAALISARRSHFLPQPARPPSIRGWYRTRTCLPMSPGLVPDTGPPQPGGIIVGQGGVLCAPQAGSGDQRASSFVGRHEIKSCEVGLDSARVRRQSWSAASWKASAHAAAAPGGRWSPVMCEIAT